MKVVAVALLAVAALPIAVEGFSAANASSIVDRRLAHPNDMLWVANNVDISGNDLLSRKGPRGDCHVHCGRNLQCRSFTWTNYQGGTCWIKSFSDRSSYRYYKGAVSTIMMNQVTVPYFYRNNCDMPGNDIGNVKAATYERCIDTCADKPACVAFVWTGFEGGTCWLKSKSPDCTVNTGAISVIVFKKQ